MKAIILAAGYGTRLYPLTRDFPKALIDVAGRPLVEHIIYRILEIEAVDEVIIVANNKFFHAFRDWLSGFSCSVPVRIVNDGTMSNEDRLGAVGDIHFAVSECGIRDSVLVVGGDNLFGFSLLGMFSFFREKGSSVVALHDLKDVRHVAGRFGVAEIGDDFRIVGFEEKPLSPKSALASTACYFFTGQDLEELEACISANRKPDNLGEFIRWLSSRKPVYGFVFSEAWFDIGSPDQLREADVFWRQRDG